MNYLGDFAADETIYFYFDSFDSSGGSVTMTGLATTDIEIYKNGSTTQRSSDAGYTLLDTDGIDFDTITGIHGFSVDTSDNTDSGFYAAGNEYVVVVSSVTIDSQTVSFVAGSFSIENRFMRGTDSAALATALATVDTNVDAILVDTGTTLPATLAGLNDFDPTTDTVANVTTVATTTTNTDMRGTDNAALATALATVDTNVDSILVDTGTTLPATLSALNDVSVSDILTTQMTESYSADGAAPTIAQALLLIQQTLGDFVISGTTVSVKKLDGSSEALTYTLNDAVSPTGTTRTT